MDISDIKDLTFELLDKLLELKTPIFVIGLIVYIFIQRHNITILNNDIDNLSNKNEKLEIANSNNLSVLEQFENDYSSLLKIYDDLVLKNNQLHSQLDKKQKVIYREVMNKKPLEELTKKKPSLIESKINKATDNNINCLNNIFEGKVCTLK